jgi:iron complex outermembrane recepter protein
MTGSIVVLAALVAVTVTQQPEPQGMQAAVPDAASDPESVIVVRGRQEQIAQLAASALSLSPEGIATLDQLATAVPGVWLVNDQDPGTNILSIRGATTDRLQQASVAMVLDGVPLADTELFTAALFDIEKIDVLRGPQGALFGRNAAGGVIGITTSGAGGEGGRVSASLGNGGRVGLEAGIPLAGFGPVSDARLAVLATHADGWITNRTLGKTVDETGTIAARLSLGGDAGPVRWNLRTHWMQEEGGAAWASSNNVTGLNGGRLDGDVLSDPIGDFEGRAWRRWFQASGRMWLDLGQGELRLVAARDSYQKRWIEELDYRPGPLTFFGFPAFPNGIQPITQPIDIRASTLDLRWNRETPRGDLMIGAFWQETFKGRVDDFGPLLFGGPPPGYDTGSTQSAIYGSWRRPVTSRLTLEAQGRLDRDRRSQTIFNSLTGARIDARKATFDRFSPRLGALYQLSDGAQVHISWAEAFRPGGFNPAPATASIWQIQYRPEITSSREIGVRWRGNHGPVRWRGSLSVFDNDVTDWQNYTFIDNQSVTLNVPEVAISGIEADVVLSGDAWSAGAALATLDATIGTFVATDPLLGSPATRDYSGRTIPNVPEQTANLWGEVRFENAGWQVTSRLTARHAGRTVYEIDNVLYSPSRVWFDLSLNLSPPSSDWNVTLQGENVTDRRWAVSAFGQGMTGLLAGLGPGGPFDTFTINRGAVWSLVLERTF